MRPLLTALLLSLAIAPVGWAQRRDVASRHLDAFRSDAELTKYYGEVMSARRRAEEAARQASPCGKDLNVKRGRRSAPGDSTVFAGTTRDVTGKPLQDVAVRIAGTTDRAVSDASGRFRLVVGGKGPPRRPHDNADRDGHRVYPAQAGGPVQRS